MAFALTEVTKVNQNVINWQLLRIVLRFYHQFHCYSFTYTYKFCCYRERGKFWKKETKIDNSFINIYLYIHWKGKYENSPWIHFLSSLLNQDLYPVCVDRRNIRERFAPNALQGVQEYLCMFFLAMCLPPFALGCRWLMSSEGGQPIAADDCTFDRGENKKRE